MKELCEHIAKKHFGENLLNIDIDVSLDPEIEDWFYVDVMIELSDVCDLDKVIKKEELFNKELLPQLPKSLACYVVTSIQFSDPPKHERGE